MSMEATDTLEHGAQLDDSQEDAAFEAAFNSARALHAEGSTPEGLTTSSDESSAGAAPVVDDAAAQAAAAQAAADAEAAAAAAAAEAEANAPVTITKADLDAMRAQLARVTDLEQQLQQTSNKAFGRMGSLQQTIDALKAQANQGGQFTGKQLKRLQAEFPDLAQMLTEDLADAFGGAGGNVSAPEHTADPLATQANPGNQVQEAADPIFDPQVQKVLQTKEMAIVDALHPGWRGQRDTAGTYVPGLTDSPEFKAWRAGLPEVAQNLLATTWDSSVLHDALTHFKNDQVARAKASATTNQRDNRLANAVPATTGQPTGINVVDDDAAFEAGFNKARTGRG